MQQPIDIAKDSITSKDYQKAEKICKENIKDPAILAIFLPLIFSKEYMSKIEAYVEYKNINSPSKMYHQIMYEICGSGADLSESQISFKFSFSTYYADNFDEVEIHSPEKHQVAEWERKVKSLEEIHSVTNVEPWMIVPTESTPPSKDAGLRVIDSGSELTAESIDSMRELSSPLSTSETLELRHRRPSMKDLALRQSSRASLLQMRTSMLGGKGIIGSRASIQGSKASINSARSSIQSLQSISGEHTLERKPSAIDRLSKKFADSSLSLNSQLSPKEMMSMPIPFDMGEELPTRDERKHSRSSMMQKKASRNSMLSSLSAISTPDSSAKNSFGSHIQSTEVIHSAVPANAGIEETLEALVTVKRSKKAAEIAAVEAKITELSKLAESENGSSKTSVTETTRHSDSESLSLNESESSKGSKLQSSSSFVEAKRSKTKFASVMASITKQKPTAEEIRNHRLHR